jgi:stress-induced morphogen
MNAQSLLSELTARGAVVSATGDRLRLQAADGVVWDNLRPAIQTLKPELLALLQSDPLTPGAIPPADGLQRRGAFIMPTRETMPAYRAHFEAKADGASTQTAPDSDRQTERIRRLAATVTAAELLAAHRTIKPTLKKQLSAIELHELALTLADAQKRENRLRRGENRPAREFIPADELKL